MDFVNGDFGFLPHMGNRAEFTLHCGFQTRRMGSALSQMEHSESHHSSLSIRKFDRPDHMIAVKANI